MTGTGRDFGRFYADNFPVLCKQLYAYTGDATEAQDAVQEAFVRAWTRWASVSRYENPAGWVRQVAWRLAISRWRRARTALRYLNGQREVHAPPPGPEHVTLVAALATLPERQRRAVVLHYLADLSIAQIATEESVAEGTVKSWLHRGRAAMAAHLDSERVEGRHDDGRA
ncbi:RNA polymerase sigma factor [Cryptosporangium sp. NPDC048952]|uniref:RNA polymerase sigma factor n=1 Tax=Cryptosporangium sp. NPDC048952 TaxID=3363961 RepID=UPI0037230779